VIIRSIARCNGVSISTLDQLVTLQPKVEDTLDLIKDFLDKS